MGTESDNVYFLAFDHRGVFARSVLDVDVPTPADDAVITTCKGILFESAMAAAPQRPDATGRVGVLIDELYGADAAMAASALDVVLAMPVEEPDLQVFDFAYGERFGEHIEQFEPDYAKVLVRCNPDGDAAGNAVQMERLARLSSWLGERDRRLLLELLVDPTPAQSAAAGGDRLRFELEQRPALIGRAIADFQAGGVEVDLWKLEGIDDPADAAAIVAQARSGDGRDDVRCMILGAGAGPERVDHWLRVAAATDGFAGFAIGRSIWREPLRDFLADRAERGATVALIAERYLRFVDVYEAAAAAAGATA